MKLLRNAPEICAYVSLRSFVESEVESWLLKHNPGQSASCSVPLFSMTQKLSHFAQCPQNGLTDVLRGTPAFDELKSIPMSTFYSEISRPFHGVPSAYVFIPKIEERLRRLCVSWCLALKKEPQIVDYNDMTIHPPHDYEIDPPRSYPHSHSSRSHHRGHSSRSRSPSHHRVHSSRSRSHGSHHFHHSSSSSSPMVSSSSSSSF